MKWIKHNQPSLDHRDQASVLKTLKSGWIAEGPVAQKFEQQMARLIHRKYAKAVSSGSAALHLALLALGIQKGDEVILSTYACTALLNSIFYVGATPRVADISVQNLGLSAESVRKLISKKTKAIIVHHAFGFPADIMKIKSFGIPIIEDCAQSLGTKIGKSQAGTFGDISIFSFYATKMMTTGYGGMLLTDSQSRFNSIRDLTHYDQRRDYKVRYNYCLSDINAALGLSQLERLDQFLKRRKTIAKRFLEALKKTSLFFWCGREGESPNYYRLPCGDIKEWKALQKYFLKNKINVINPLEPFQLLHRYLNQSARMFPVAETISRSIISLPIYPSLRDSEIERVCRSILLLK